MTALTLRERLKQETRPWHDAVEQAMSPVGSGSPLEQYARMLRLFYGFYAPLEQLVPLFSPEQSFDRQDRRKAALVPLDLRNLGQPAVLPVCLDLPPLATPAEQVGCLYVVEGSTLGAQYIFKQASQTLAITPQHGGRFLTCYGSRTGANWNAFTQHLATFEYQADAVVRSAGLTFEKFHAWIAAFDATPTVSG